jgi:hypothetical protein
VSTDLLILVAVALLLLVLLRRPGWSSKLVGRLRAAPVELAAAVVLLAIVGAVLLDGVITFGVALAVLAGLVLIAGYDAVRDYVLGVLLRVSGRIRLGDIVVIDGHEGVVAEIGRLNLLLDDARGRLLVPHSKAVRGIVHRRSQRVGPLPHRFEIEWRGERSHADVSRLISRTVLLHSRAAAGRDPEVEPLGPRTASVTVYVVASAHGFEIERAVRDALGEDEAPRKLTLPPPPDQD